MTQKSFSPGSQAWMPPPHAGQKKRKRSSLGTSTSDSTAKRSRSTLATVGGKAAIMETTVPIIQVRFPLIFINLLAVYIF